MKDSEPLSEDKMDITFEACKKTVAEKHGLGKTLVTGHLAKYWQEAAELYASQFKSKDYIPERDSQTFSIEDMRAAFYAGKDHTADEYRDGQSIGFDEWISTRKPS